MGASGSFLLLSLPLSAEGWSEQGAELWRGTSCRSDFAVELWGTDADPQDVARDVTCSVSTTLLRPAYPDMLRIMESFRPLRSSPATNPTLPSYH